MQIPGLPTGPEEIKKEEHSQKDLVLNIYKDKEFLTKVEALNLLNHITAVLLIYESER